MWKWFKAFWKGDKVFRYLIYFIWISALIYELTDKQSGVPWAFVVAAGASVFYIRMAYIFRNNP